jgi:hypothetical protein
MWFIPSPDLLMVARWLPTRPETHKFDVVYCMHESQLDQPNIEEAKQHVHSWLEQIQAEDSGIVEQIQRTLSSTRSASGGALSHLERPVWQFQKYLADRLLPVSTH